MKHPIPKNIDIKYKTETSDCDTCGMNWSRGVTIRFDKKVVYELKPSAGCFGNPDMNSDEVLNVLGQLLGIKITEDGSPIHVSYVHYKEGFIKTAKTANTVG